MSRPSARLSSSIAVTAATLAIAAMQTGCVMIGYRSGAGWFVWPGGVGLILLVIVLLMLFRRGGP